MSPPAAKASSPAPRTITQRTLSSPAICAIAADSPRHMAALTALSLAGLCKVTVASPSPISRSMRVRMGGGLFDK